MPEGEVKIIGQWGGKRDGAGRPVGAATLFTKQFKKLLMETYNQLELDGKGMYHWAKENPTEFYKICSRLIPTEIAVTATENMIIEWANNSKEIPSPLPPSPEIK